MFALVDSRGDQKVAKDGSFVIVVLHQSGGPPEVRISTKTQLAKPLPPKSPSPGKPGHIVPVTPDMPYVCTITWSNLTGDSNPPQCAACWAGRWRECYDKLKCQWDDTAMSVMCKVGKPLEFGQPFYGHQAMVGPLSHHVGLGTPYWCTDEYSARTGKPNPMGCELCWTTRKKECYRKFQCEWRKIPQDDGFPLHILGCKDLRQMGGIT